MAIDNLNIMTSGLPAGQQTDQYSTKPGCLRSKNLDIFSSSKSVKGTAWSSASQSGSDIIYDDGKLCLKTDDKVYENGTLFVNPNTNFKHYDISYDGKYGNYAPAQYGTSKDMVVKYGTDDWETFTVFTDRSSYTYTKNGVIVDKSFGPLQSGLAFENNEQERWRWTYNSTMGQCEGYMIFKTDNNKSWCSIDIVVQPGFIGKFPLVIGAYKYHGQDDDATPYLDYIATYKWEYYYDAQTDTMVPHIVSTKTTNYDRYRDLYTDPYYLMMDMQPNTASSGYTFRIYFGWNQKDGRTTFTREDALMIDFLGGPDKEWSVEKLVYRQPQIGDQGQTLYADCYEYYNYLPISAQRKLKKIGEYYWMKGKTTQTLYSYNESWWTTSTGGKTPNYTLEQYMARDNPSTMDVVDMISRNERIYMIGNMDGNGYIIPCDLTGGKGTPYIAYGCTFKGVTNIDYLMYLVGEDRGVSQLWCYNTQELVPLIGGDKKKVEIDSLTHEKGDRDIVNTSEQYRFDGRLVEYRGDLVLSTEDNRLFQYGQTAGGKGGTFIFDVPGTITDLKVDGDNLIVSYEVTVTETDENEQEVEVTYKYNRIYQDDIADKNYLTNREATYPIAIGNHLLEKEESDLYTSYILPSKDCKLEFWGAGNHYHFWSFKVGDPMNGISRSNGLNLLRTKKLELLGTTGDYYLEYVEDDGERFTYRLVGDLPQQTSNSQMALARFTPQHTDDGIFTFTEFNHFRKIGEITTDSYIEGEYRFHNLNNKLELPKTHSLQIMVKGTGTSKATPELFTVDLIANQRERG